MAFKTTTNWKKYRLWCSEFMVFILDSFFFFNAFHFFLFCQYLKFQIFFPSKKLALFDYLLLVLFFYRSLNQWWIFLFSAFIPVKASSMFSVQAKRKELIILPISFSTRLSLSTETRSVREISLPSVPNWPSQIQRSWILMSLWNIFTN